MPWIRRVRTSQPLEAVGIDWDNPLTQDLISAPLAHIGIDAVSGWPLIYGSPGRVLVTGPAGNAFSGDANFRYAAARVAASMSEYTQLAVVQGTTTTTDKYFIGAGGAAASPIFGIGTGAINGAKIRVWARTDAGPNTAISVESTNNWTTKTPVSLATRVLNGTISAFIGGRLEGSTAQVSGTYTCTHFNVGAGSWRSGAQSFQSANQVYCGFLWRKGLSNSAIEELSANPWQLFEPELVWVPVSAGGATYTLTADSGSFALTGQDAGLAFNRTLAAASGSFALTGQDAGLAFNRVLSAANGSYALDGQDVTLTYTPISGATYTLTAASGSFALTGQDTGLAFNRVLTADTQSYSLSGDVAGLAFNRVLAADTVSYALTGQDVTLTYTSNGFTYTLTAESGSFEVTGQDASLRHTTTAIAGGGGWLPQTRRKSRKQIYEERVKLGILPPPVIKAAAKVAAVAQTVEEFKEERPKYEEMFLKAIKKTEWLPDYTRAIQAQLAIMEQEEEELLLLL